MIILSSKEYEELLKGVGVSYIGNVAHSAKLSASYRNGTMTYCIYLAPSDMSGHNVCPNSEYCRDFCLNGSGRNRGDIILHGAELSNINKARVKKTNLFYDDRSLFIRLVIRELFKAQEKANKMNMDFSVRLNGTSDLSPVIFKGDDGKNLLELFPQIQFYDYTKVPSRVKLLKEYTNYDITFSHNGYNWGDCEKFLECGGKVAVVFYGNKLPKFFNGYKVVDGNNYDMRYLDEPRSIVGLHYHRTANDYKVIDGKRRFIIPNTPFVIMPNDERCEW